LGDVAVVVTRYFGGTKLGKGGLVRAYSDSVRAILEVLPRAEKVETHTVMVALQYNWLERMRLLVSAHHGEVLDETFGVEVTLTARFAIDYYPAFQEALVQASHGTLEAEVVETKVTIMPVGALK
jgi:putative IMPACT (imprinted ancient) family translation regulator